MVKQRTREQKVQEFHEAMGLPVNGQPTCHILELRRRLIMEEAEEVCDVLQEMEICQVYGKDPTTQQWEHLLKELADLQYVLSGTLVSFNRTNKADFDAAFNCVHDSNMSKLDDNGQPIRDNITGKVMKGPNYEEANLGGLI
jgi:predicted HAD superfamily Cof-like phosphohydrolase